MCKMFFLISVSFCSKWPFLSPFSSVLSSLWPLCVVIKIITEKADKSRHLIGRLLRNEVVLSISLLHRYFSDWPPAKNEARKRFGEDFDGLSVESRVATSKSVTPKRIDPLITPIFHSSTYKFSTVAQFSEPGHVGPEGKTIDCSVF